MKRNFLLGLVTTAALFAAPVAASEVPDNTPIRSTRQDVEEIKDMRRASKARFEGDLYFNEPAPVQAPAPEPVPTPESVASASEPAPAPVAPAPEPVPTPEPVASASEPAPVQAPAPEPVPTPESVASASEPAPAPVAPTSVPAPAPAPVPASAPAPLQAPALEPVPAPAPAPAPVPAPASSVKGTATEVIPPACLGREWPKDKASLDYQFRQEHMVCLLATDVAWSRADQQDYSLGADLERGMQPLSALEKHSPHLLPKALAILRGKENYT